jgi:hypothetical protein
LEQKRANRSKTIGGSTGEESISVGVHHQSLVNSISSFKNGAFLLPFNFTGGNIISPKVET